MFQSLDFFVLSCLFLTVSSQQGLVEGLKCYVHATRQTHCSWNQAPDRHADLRFYYRVVRSDGSVSVYDKLSQEVQECSSYNDTDGIRTGCDLEADNSDEIFIFINGTLNNTHVLYNDKIRPYVQPPALNWTVTKNGGKFHINWTLPNINVKWKTTIRYTECKETKNKSYVEGETSVVWDVVSHCSYRMDIRTKPLNVEGNESPWSEEKYFEKDTNLWPYAAIIIPLMFAGLAALIFVCCRKNKDIIFPKVPEPRNFLSDISDNNNKITVRYIPAEEEEHCKITLVEDPLTLLT